jgi:hypothetical protein
MEGRRNERREKGKERRGERGDEGRDCYIMFNRVQ